MKEKNAKTVASKKRPQQVTVTSYSRQVKKRGPKFCLFLGLFYSPYAISLIIKMLAGNVECDHHSIFSVLIFLAASILGWISYFETHLEWEKCSADDEGAVARFSYTKYIYPEEEEKKEEELNNTPEQGTPQVKSTFFEKLGCLAALSIPIVLYIKSVLNTESSEIVAIFTFLVFIVALLLNSSDGQIHEGFNQTDWRG